MSTYIKRKSDRQERRTAKEFGGRTQIASGALEGMKGDVRTGERNAGTFNEEDFLIENKYTEAVSYKLSLATWDKIEKEALRDNFRTPLMQIDIQDTEIVVAGAYGLGFGAYTTATLRYSGKSATLNCNTVEEIFINADIIVLDFYKVNRKLYVVRKEDFLRNLP